MSLKVPLERTDRRVQSVESRRFSETPGGLKTIIKESLAEIEAGRLRVTEIWNRRVRRITIFDGDEIVTKECCYLADPTNESWDDNVDLMEMIELAYPISPLFTIFLVCLRVSSGRIDILDRLLALGMPIEEFKILFTYSFIIDISFGCSREAEFSHKMPLGTFEWIVSKGLIAIFSDLRPTLGNYNTNRFEIEGDQSLLVNWGFETSLRLTNATYMTMKGKVTPRLRTTLIDFLEANRHEFRMTSGNYFALMLLDDYAFMPDSFGLPSGDDCCDDDSDEEYWIDSEEGDEDEDGEDDCFRIDYLWIPRETKKHFQRFLDHNRFDDPEQRETWREYAAKLSDAIRVKFIDTRYEDHWGDWGD